MHLCYYNQETHGTGAAGELKMLQQKNDFEEKRQTLQMWDAEKCKEGTTTQAVKSMGGRQPRVLPLHYRTGKK